MVLPPSTSPRSSSWCGVYRALPHRGQNWWLLAASYYFYAAWDWRFLSLLIGSTLVDFVVTRHPS